MSVTQNTLSLEKMIWEWGKMKFNAIYFSCCSVEKLEVLFMKKIESRFSIKCLPKLCKKYSRVNSWKLDLTLFFFWQTDLWIVRNMRGILNFETSRRLKIWVFCCIRREHRPINHPWASICKRRLVTSHVFDSLHNFKWKVTGYLRWQKRWS